MVERGSALGLRVAVADLLPWNNGYPEADPKIRRLNELIHAVAQRRGVPVLPFYATLEDPGPPRADEGGVDVGRRPPVRRGLPPAGRAGVPPSTAREGTVRRLAA